MDFSVIICTYNRSSNLPLCLGALSKQQEASNINWEVLVVDNNSTDDTHSMVKKLSNSLPISIRYTKETDQGLNYARNRGIKESEGKYFAFIDDDILVNSEWLASVYQCFLDTDADAVGGRIHLDPSLKMPKWIQKEIHGFLGYQDNGEISYRMDGIKQYPFGGNMSFNRRVVDKIGFFNPKLGRKGSGNKRKELFKGAETDYFHRLAEHNPIIFYQPKAIVYHQVVSHQLTKKYFRTIHFNAGYQKALFDDGIYSRTFIGIPLFLFPQFFRSLLHYFPILITKGPNIAFRQQMTVGHFIGQILGYNAKYKKKGHH